MGTGGESFHHNPRIMTTTQSLISETEALIAKIPSIFADLDNCINEYNSCIERKLILIAELKNIASALKD
jgi:hypothetical protein